MSFRTRHQKKTIDCVVLDASEWKNTRQPTLPDGNTALLNGGLNRPVHLCETGVQMALHGRLERVSSSHRLSVVARKGSLLEGLRRGIACIFKIGEDQA